jgi:hypothetical protein
MTIQELEDHRVMLIAAALSLHEKLGRKIKAIAACEQEIRELEAKDK